VPARAAPAQDCAGLARGAAAAGARAAEWAAEWIEADPAAPWRGPDSLFGRARMDRPFCRVTGQLRAPGGSSVRFELWLPPPERWNGRFFGTASAGLAGAVSQRALVNPVTRGYAALAHDSGHAGGLDDIASLRGADGRLSDARLGDFAEQAQHLATVAGKAVTAAFYGRPPQRAYFLGCGQGGHHGLMEAARHPEDYDGIVAGAPLADWSRALANQAWAAHWADRPGALPDRDALVRLAEDGRQACDGRDGAADGQVEDPRRCPAATVDNRLTPPQSALVQALSAGAPLGDRTAGYEPGSEAWWAAGWSRQSPRALPLGRALLELAGGATPGTLARLAARLAPRLDVPPGPLNAFAQRGGRLILYHGWADPLAPPRLTLARWDALAADGAARDRFARLFMVPAMGHCAGGPVGASDWLSAIEGWVERAIPPDPGTVNAVVGSGSAAGRLRERVLCPYPAEARYQGSGDLNADGNFRCVTP
jgi:feruloyl esterase